MNTKKLRLPLSTEAIRELKAGDRLYLTGELYTARDEAHLKILQLLESGEAPPIKLKGECIYYTGPCPAPPGRVIGSAGPTTSGRMDAMTPPLLELGLKAMIGKGERSEAVIESIKKNICVYFAATSGAGALLAESVRRCETAAFPELGPEAVYRLYVEDFPAIVAIDCEGRDIYKYGRAEYEEKESERE